MKRILLLIATLGISTSAVLSQQPTSTPPEDQQVVKISTDLIQIDVTVTDKNGKPVSGLGMNDFEVYENGAKQSLTGAYFMTRSMGGATIGGRSNSGAG